MARNWTKLIMVRKKRRNLRSSFFTNSPLNYRLGLHSSFFIILASFMSSRSSHLTGPYFWSSQKPGQAPRYFKLNSRDRITVIQVILFNFSS